MVFIIKIHLLIFICICNSGDGVTAFHETTNKIGSFMATEPFTTEKKKAAVNSENMSAKEICEQWTELNNLILVKNKKHEQTKMEAQTYLNHREFKDPFKDEMWKIVNIHGKMPEIIQLKEVKREGIKMLKNMLENLKTEKKTQMDAELAKLKGENDEQIKGLKKDTNYKTKVAVIIEDFDREKHTLDKNELEKLQNEKKLESEAEQPIKLEYKSYVQKITHEIKNKVNAINQEYDEFYGQAISIMKDLYAAYKKATRKWISLNFLKTGSQKKKSKMRTEMAIKTTFNGFAHENGRKEERIGQVKEAATNPSEAEMNKLLRTVSQEKRLLKNSSGTQIFKGFKLLLALKSLRRKSRRRSKREVGIGGIQAVHLFGDERSHFDGIHKSKFAPESLIKDQAEFMKIWNKANMFNPPNRNGEKTVREAEHEEEENLADVKMPQIIIGRESDESDTDSSIFSSKRSDFGSSFSSLSSKISTSLHSHLQSSSFDSVGSSRYADLAELHDDVVTMTEEQETTHQFIHEFNDAKVSVGGKFSHKMLHKFGELQKLDKQMRDKCADVKKVEAKYDRFLENTEKQLAKQLEPLRIELGEKLNEIVKEHKNKLIELERVKKEKLIRLNKGEKLLYEYIDEKDKSKTLLPLATFLEKVGTDFTDKSDRAIELQRRAEQDINRKLLVLANFEEKLAHIAQLEKDIGKIKAEMGKIEKEIGGGTKEKLEEKCKEELEEFVDANDEFESDSSGFESD